VDLGDARQLVVDMLSRSQTAATWAHPSANLQRIDAELRGIRDAGDVEVSSIEMNGRRVDAHLPPRYMTLWFDEDAEVVRTVRRCAAPILGSEPFLVLQTAEVFGHPEEYKFFPEMRRIARQAFLVLERSWSLEAGTLVDFKVEFGFDAKGNLLLADVIDNDSWRVIENGAYIDKQVYRDGGALDTVAAKYRQVAETTAHFRVPRQRIILWRGSETDKTEAFSQALGELKDMMTVVTCSIHKEPVAGAGILNKLIQEVPDSVVIAFIGRSNGAGPVLSAQSTVPVITVPASAKDFPEDVWSSLRAPSKVPVMTVLEPSNAVLAALQILSARNPRVYAQVRGEIENRMVNTLTI